MIFFVCSHTHHDYILDSSNFKDPIKWVAAIKLKCDKYNPLNNTLGHIICEILRPTTDSVKQTE